MKTRSFTEIPPASSAVKSGWSNHIFPANVIPMTGTPEICQVELRDIAGKPTSLVAYAGKVLFIVNVASKCGFTPHYTGLQELHERYHERGLIVCGFPCNDFGGQEPGTEDEVKKFCTLNYGVTFPMFAKVQVRGKEMHPLFRLLVDHSRHGGSVKWNFSKFLIDREGEVQDRFAPFTKPTARRVVRAIEKILDQPVAKTT